MRLIVDSRDRSLGNDPFKCSVFINPPIQNVKRLNLQSLSIPFCWYAVRENFDTFVFTLYDDLQANQGLFTVAIPHGNYTSTQLSIALQTAIYGATSMGPTVAVNSLTSKFSITMPNDYSIVVHGSGLATSILGFKDNETPVGSVTTASNRFNLNHDLYINMVINNVSSDFRSGVTSFHIPVLVFPNEIINNLSNLTFDQYVSLNGQTLSMLEIRFRDRYDNELKNNGVDWSMVFSIE